MEMLKIWLTFLAKADFALKTVKIDLILNDQSLAIVTRMLLFFLCLTFWEGDSKIFKKGF